MSPTAVIVRLEGVERFPLVVQGLLEGHVAAGGEQQVVGQQDRVLKDDVQAGHLVGG